MRVKLFRGLANRERQLQKLQHKVNRWLRRLGQHPEFRIVSHTFQGYYEDSGGNCIGVVSIWYEKVRKEGDA